LRRLPGKKKGQDVWLLTRGKLPKPPQIRTLRKDQPVRRWLGEPAA
jgi:hypothetical protein